MGLISSLFTESQFDDYRELQNILEAEEDDNFDMPDDTEEQDQQQQQQPPQQNEDEMSKENAEQLLNSVMQDEKSVQEKVNKKQVIKGRSLEKDW